MLLRGAKEKIKIQASDHEHMLSAFYKGSSSTPRMPKLLLAAPPCDQGERREEPMTSEAEHTGGLCRRCPASSSLHSVSFKIACILDHLRDRQPVSERPMNSLSIHHSISLYFLSVEKQINSSFKCFGFCSLTHTHQEFLPVLGGIILHNPHNFL